MRSPSRPATPSTSTTARRFHISDLFDLPRGAGSIYPRRNGYTGYMWITTPAGQRKRKYIYGATPEEAYTHWIALYRLAANSPVPTRNPSLRQYLDHWLHTTLASFAKPKTVETYGLIIRLYINPGLGPKPLHKLATRDVRRWLATP